MQMLKQFSPRSDPPPNLHKPSDKRRLLTHAFLRVEFDWGLISQKTPQSYSTKSDSLSLYCLWKHHNLPCKQKVHLTEKAEVKKKDSQSQNVKKVRPRCWSVECYWNRHKRSSRCPNTGCVWANDLLHQVWLINIEYGWQPLQNIAGLNWSLSWNDWFNLLTKQFTWQNCYTSNIINDWDRDVGQTGLKYPFAWKGRSAKYFGEVRNIKNESHHDATELTQECLYWLSAAK